MRPSLPADVNAAARSARSNPTKKTQPSKKTDDSVEVYHSWSRIFVRTKGGVAWYDGIETIAIPWGVAPKSDEQKLRKTVSKFKWVRVKGKLTHSKETLALLKKAILKRDVLTDKRAGKSLVTSGVRVTLYGFGPDTKRMIAAVKKAFATAKKTWRYSPLAMDFVRYGGLGGVMGFTTPGKPQIRISAEAFKYDDASVLRTVLHELCHQHRYDSFGRKMPAEGKEHDTIFCAELSKVDPVVRKHKRECSKFHNDLNRKFGQ